MQHYQVFVFTTLRCAAVLVAVFAIFVAKNGVTLVSYKIAFNLKKGSVFLPTLLSF
jgi:hypothetical protein